MWSLASWRHWTRPKPCNVLPGSHREIMVRVSHLLHEAVIGPRSRRRPFCINSTPNRVAAKQLSRHPGSVSDLHLHVILGPLVKEVTMVLIPVCCPYCYSDDVIKGGKTT